jgi:hypothetical protein
LLSNLSLALGNPFSLVEFTPQIRGDLLLNNYERQRLWMGGMFESCAQLVTFIKDKCSSCACFNLLHVFIYDLCGYFLYDVANK